MTEADAEKPELKGWLDRTECPGCHGIFGAKYLADHMLVCVPYLKGHGWSRNEELAVLEHRLDGLLTGVRLAREMKDAMDKQVTNVASAIQVIRERAAKVKTQSQSADEVA